MHFYPKVRLVLGVCVSLALAQQKCNGFEALCDRSLGNVTFIGAHDSFAYPAGSTGASTAVGGSSNQYVGVSQQLQDGVRMLQGQGHKINPLYDNSSVELCHTNCALLDGGNLTSYLQKVVSFLDSNPNEVIILLWVNSEEPLPVSSWGNSYKVSGLDKYSYTPKQTPVANYAWPTLSELIADGKRAVSFMDSGADYSAVPYILDEFSMIFETVPDPQDNDFPCTLDRPQGGSPDGRMYLVNHNLNHKISDTSSITLPSLEEINTTNSACGPHTIEQQVNNCVNLYNRNPNIIMLDYYNYPAHDPFEAANHLNGVGPDPCDNSTSTGSSPAAGTASNVPTTSATASSAVSPAISSGASGPRGIGSTALYFSPLITIAICFLRLGL